jgi:hypothetical protein
MILDRERRGAHFVGGAEIDPVDLAMRRHGVEVDHARGEDDR